MQWIFIVRNRKLLGCWDLRDSSSKTWASFDSFFWHQFEIFQLLDGDCKYSRVIQRHRRLMASATSIETDSSARQCLGINDYLPSVATFQTAESQVKLFSSAAIDGWPSTDRRVISDQLGEVFLPPDAGSLRSGHCHQHKLSLVSLTSKIAFQGREILHEVARRLVAVLDIWGEEVSWGVGRSEYLVWV